jgi:acyl-CoA reductase-like NAD-dependent aldehyde dehydrogenase
VETLTNFVAGKWVPSLGKDTIDVVDPATETLVGRLPAGSADDVDAAVRSATGAPERSRTLPVGMVWINQWQAGGLDRTYEPAGNSGLGITGRTAAFDAATRQATVITGQP